MLSFCSAILQKNGDEPIMMSELERKAASLMDECTSVSIASVRGDGYPRVCVVSKLRAEGFSEIYFSTGTRSTKVKHFRSNSRSSICYYRGGDSVTLVGDVTIVEDHQVKAELWQEWLIDHFPEGPTDPNYCIVKFTTKEATIWIDQHFETFTYAD